MNIKLGLFKNKIYLVVLFLLFMLGGCHIKKDNIELNDFAKEITLTKVIINEQEYILNLEQNATAKSFVLLLPQEFSMNELNGNEKYVYLETTLPTNAFHPKRIDAGDVMLYGNNCLVLFYKSFETSYSYSKIGHIDNLPDLGNENLVIKIMNE